MDRDDDDVSVEMAARFGLHDLARLRESMTRAARLAGLDDDRGSQLVLAVNEAATNAIRHGSGHADVTVSRTDHAIIVEVTDEGPGISTTASALPPPIEATSGRGLWLVHHLCDRVDIHTGHWGTRIQLTMAISS
jgi:anti-sigma regulatory factor (Ser/Thr protein kinase)